MNKQQLASKIWESANKMRSKIEANEYKDYILGFIFYKFLSDKQLEIIKNDEFDKEEVNETNKDVVDYMQQQLGYFISYENLYSSWIEKGNQFDISDVTYAISAFNRMISGTHKKLFEGIFETLETGLSKLGSTTAERTKAVRDLLYLIKDIPMDGSQDYDVLGFVYEYLISMFAANAGKKAGEFYTPHEVSLLMSEIVANHNKGKDEISIYDPTSGSGSLLINIGKSVSKYLKSKDKIKYYAQELKKNTYDLTRMNLIMRGINPSNIKTRNADTLEDDWPYFDENDPNRTYEVLYIDAVVSNPPYSQAWNPENKESDPRYKDYGLAPKSKADYAFLLHDLYHVKPDGIMTIVLPHGVLFRGGQEGEIRKNLIEKNNIDAVIGLPSNIFFGTGIPTIIMILKQTKNDDDVLIIDASKGFVKEGKNNVLRASDIKKIVDTVISRESIDKFSRLVSKDEIRENDYNLNIPRYVDTSAKTEEWDVYSTMFGGIPNKEINDLNKYWEVFPSLKEELFSVENADYSLINQGNISEIINNNEDVIKFNQEFINIFNDFEEKLEKILIDNLEEITPSKVKEEVTSIIFNKLNDIKLIDKYEAYQIFDNSWTDTELDLEVIQIEGVESLKKVEPNMVLKKVRNVEQEVQDGWKGKIFSFEMIQKLKLRDELDIITNIDNRINEIKETITELYDSIDEENKDKVSNDNNDAFNNPKLNAEYKNIQAELGKDAKYDEDSYEYIVQTVINLNVEERELNREFRDLNTKLIDLTKETIETLTDDEAIEILKYKWIKTLKSELLELPNKISVEFESLITKLSKKYEETYLDLEKEIKDTSRALANMLNELEGSDFDMKGLEGLKKMLLGDINE